MDALKEHTIAFAGLKDGTHTFAYQLGKSFFDAAGVEDFESGDVAVEVEMDKSLTMLVTKIRVEGPVSVRCYHCDGPLDLALKGDQRQIFQLTDEGEFDDDELVGLGTKAYEVNLTHYIYECLRLSAPARMVHEPGQCDPEAEKLLGRLSVEHEPIPDPRWAVLDKLKNKQR